MNELRFIQFNETSDYFFATFGRCDRNRAAVSGPAATQAWESFEAWMNENFGQPAHNGRWYRSGGVVGITTPLDAFEFKVRWC